MAPVAIESSSLSSIISTPPVALKSPALVIGSLATANDGSYQALITELEVSRTVERLLADRLLDGGTLRTHNFRL
jgi:hypothetical protein